MPLLFGLASGGVYNAVFVTKHAVRSYRTLSPLLKKRAVKPVNGRTLLCAYITMSSSGLLSVALSMGSHPPDVIRHRVFMKPGLSSKCKTLRGYPTFWHKCYMASSSKKQYKTTLRVASDLHIKKKPLRRAGTLGGSLISRKTVARLRA